jgi:hypothetical protein
MVACGMRGWVDGAVGGSLRRPRYPGLSAAIEGCGVTSQVPTIGVTIEKIMAARAFTLGATDARARLPFHRDYDRWDTNAQWNYERGRAWAILTPREIPLLRNGRVSPEALKWGKRLMSFDWRSPSQKPARLRNLLRRPPAPAKDRGCLQRQIRRAFLVHGPVVSSSAIYDWAFARRPQQRRSQLHRWSVVRILRVIAVPVRRVPPNGAWLWRFPVTCSYVPKYERYSNIR